MIISFRCYGDGARPLCNWVISSVISHCAQTTFQVCSHCKAEQPLKQRLKKKLQRFDEKREKWVVGRKKNHNSASIKDEASVMLEKLHAIGYKPVLLLGKEDKKKKIKCEIVMPRCTLSTFAQDYLQKIGSLHEYLCEGWTQDSNGNEDQLITLQLIPCEASPTGGQVEQASPTEGQVAQASPTEGQVAQASPTEGQVAQASPTEGQVAQASPTEGQVAQASPTEGQVAQASPTEGQVAQASPTEGQVEQASPTEGQVAQASPTEGQVEQASPTEGQVEQASPTEGQAVFTGSARDTVTSRKNKTSGVPRHMPERKRQQKNCSYHTRLEVFPIKSVLRERVRKGKAEMLVDWEPCPVCGEQWAHSWQPKDSLQNNENK
ncbi:ribosome-binding protein 1-like [Esox lucius]|uniref:ribosome-binding protein 1-like n=1 Tax=Esox lucius TaxID=8010 RepID=UPI0014773260|nr:ribosome-binding protein 1-like [Esox lucius]